MLQEKRKRRSRSTGTIIGILSINNKEYVLNNQIYVPLPGNNTEEKLEILDAYHFEVFEITDILYEVPFAQEKQDMYIVGVRYNQEYNGGNMETFEELKNTGGTG